MLGLIVKSATAQVLSTSPVPYVEKEIVYWDFHSSMIGEDYTLYVHFPPGYDTSRSSYPVLYMTDGDWNMTVAMNCFNMLRQDYTTTEPLIVGIGYGTRKNMRSRDLDPATGGPKFLEFIEKEVIPFVKSKYRVTDNKALYGYSYGGMFTTSVLFTHPDLFNMIFIGAPGNEGRDLVPSARKYFASHKQLKSKIFLGVGSFEHETASNIDTFRTYLLNQKAQGLDVATAVTPGAGHGAALAQVMQNAIAFGYCHKHQAIQLPEKSLEAYTGIYAVAAEPKEKYKVYIEKGKLYFKGQGQPQEFTPCAKDSFFMYENEKADIVFKTENNKTYILYGFVNEKPTRLDKVAN